MGGSGSGRYSWGKDTTEGYRSIDVRWLKREGMLSPGATRRITWSRHGEVVASINVRSEPGRMILTYRHRGGGGDWKDESYPVHLVTTSCHIGGERPWFLCPARVSAASLSRCFTGVASSRVASATGSPILRSAKTLEIGQHGGRIASATAWAGLEASWKGQVGASPRGCTGAPMNA